MDRMRLILPAQMQVGEMYQLKVRVGEEMQVSKALAVSVDPDGQLWVVSLTDTEKRIRLYTE